jgi:hypothetical protein
MRLFLCLVLGALCAPMLPVAPTLAGAFPCETNKTLKQFNYVWVGLGTSKWERVEAAVMKAFDRRFPDATNRPSVAYCSRTVDGLAFYNFASAAERVEWESIAHRAANSVEQGTPVLNIRH